VVPPSSFQLASHRDPSKNFLAVRLCGFQADSYGVPVAQSQGDFHQVVEEVLRIRNKGLRKFAERLVFFH
jgi:hypothetical protein